jgi:hypothetical protein
MMVLKEGKEGRVEFKPGDFVRLKEDPIGDVGVVCQDKSEETAPVFVYWWYGTLTMMNRHQPTALELVAPSEAPDYAVRVKQSLGL